ncbi:LacI family DNA-binding transcriptional regulator [Roseiflexus castenholzii]|uniref:LacI family DNA-binding transcriptional regulator n=1 Tax=Roseiflexus castenholzii TaxID=120962 RepID=UPI003C7E5479
MRRRSTIREVASRAGVSYQTVSRVINNSPDVADATREHVLRVIAELDYHPNAQAVSLSRNRTDIVGIIVDTVTSTFFAQTIDGVVKALRRHGRFTLLATVEDATQFDVIDTLQRSRRIDGMVIVLPLANSLSLSRLTPGRVPIVHIDLQYDMDVYGITVNNYRGARLATEHLIDLGHRRIGIITGRHDIPVGQLRLDGYRAALRDHGIPFDPTLIAPGDFSFASGVAGAERLLALDPRPTAIFACNDLMAIGTLHVATRYGLRIPADLSVMGFDDTPEAALACPPLTTMRQPLRAMGEMAADLVCRLIDGEQPEQMRYTVETELVVRFSTGRCPGD